MTSSGLAGVVLVVLTLASVTEESIFGLFLPFRGIPLLSSNGVKWNNLKLKYNPFFTGVYSIPLSKSKIGKEYQFLQAHKDLPLVSLYCYKDDPRVCIMYDDKGNICGVRVSYIIDHLKGRTPKGETFPYSFDDKPIFKKGLAMGKQVYYIDVFFIHPDVLKAGGPATRDEAVGTGVYISMDGKTYTEMPRNEKDTEKTEFTKQGWLIGMGRHYFYKMTETMACEDHNPVFLLYHGGELVGIGLIPFGTFDSKFGRPWFEDPFKKVVKTIVPKGPECLADWVDIYGTTSLHFYFREINQLTYVL